MVREFYYEGFSRQFRIWKKECTGRTRLMTNIKMAEKDHKKKDELF